MTTIISNGWRCVLGGFLIHLVLGTLYCWGIITTAVTAHLRKYDPGLMYNETLMVYAMALLFQGLTMLLGGVMGKRIGIRKTCLIGGYILVLGTYLSAFAKSLPVLLVTNGVMFGIGVGICYSSPIVCATSWLPERKGLVTGIIVGGFGGGACGFGLLATLVLQWTPQARADQLVDGYYDPNSAIANMVPTLYVVLGTAYFMFITAGSLLLVERMDGDGTFNAINKDNIVEDKVHHDKRISNPLQLYAKLGVDENELDSSRRNQEVCSTDLEDISSTDASNLRNDSRSMYQFLESSTSDETNVGVIELSNFGTNQLGSADRRAIDDSSCHQPSPLDTNQRDSLEIDGFNKAVAPVFGPWELFCDALGWHVALCFASTAVGGMFIAGTYKTYAQLSFSHAETFLSALGSSAAVFNASGRVVWGAIADKIGAVKTLMILSSCFSLLQFTYSFTPDFGHAAFALWTYAIFFFEGGNFVLYVPIVMHLFGLQNAGSNYGLIFSCYSMCNVTSIFVIAVLNLSFLHATVVTGTITVIGFLNLITLQWHIKRRLTLEIK